MAAAQQFSLRWNNYSQHIVTALEDLRGDDELTDVTLSCEGQRIKGHKILLSACSSYFRDTFKENPCKHPIIILKGVSFVDLEAVVTFMYNGQVNVSQERLPTFLQTAELLQIKGLTDMNEKEDLPKKRPATGTLPINQNSNSSLSHSASRSGTPDTNVQRPPSPKRKRAAADTFANDGASSSGGAFPSSSSNTPLSLPVMGGSNGALAGSSSGVISGLTNQSVAGASGVSSMSAGNQAESDDAFHPNVSIKYEDDGLQDDDEYDDKQNMSSEDNDNSIQDMMCNVEPGSIEVVEGCWHRTKTAKGFERLHGQGYSYSLMSDKKCGGQSWRCVYRSCKGRTQTFSDSPRVEVTSLHNHYPGQKSAPRYVSYNPSSGFPYDPHL